MFKKISLALVAVALVSFFGACSAEKYADVKAAMNKVIAATETLKADLDKVTDAKSAAAALNKYADVMIAEQPNMTAIQAKYPELKDAQEPPVELKEVYEKMATVSAAMFEPMMKIQAYQDDPEVMAAIIKLSSGAANPSSESEVPEPIAE